MIKEEEKDGASGGSWRTYSRSVSWTERPPRASTSTSKPQWNSKARSCLPPLQPLSIIRPSIEEWPRAGSDDLGVWPNNPPTPGGKPPGSVTPRENSNSDQPPREFEFRKDKLAFFNKECSRILDHIYLGSDAIAKNREILRQNGITHVLNCVGFVCPEYFKNELVYKTLWLQDCPSEDITSILYDVFDYFEDVQEQSGRVLVHCCQGVSRSTSLVIAYLMWKEGQSFDDAFQHVKAARGVTNPNVGFACQLLQCQKRVHALPASPTSLLRMYRMAPHSPYDPLHLVPKMLSEPGPDKLDSRGAFIIQIPSALYVWIGKHCPAMLSDNAKAATLQVIRYERAQGPVITIKEGEETFEFWDALTYRKSLTDGCEAMSEEVKSLSAGSHLVTELIHPGLDQRKLAEYDLDFEIFNRALAGGVVPLSPLSGAETETCLPARETGWNRFRRKFSSGVVKELLTSSKLNSCKFALPICGELLTMDTCKEVDDFVSPANLSTSTSDKCDSPDSLSSYVTSSPACSKNNLTEVAFPAPLSDCSLSRSPSFNLVESFSSFLVSKPKSSSTSPSLSPSTSDYSSSFTFSPSSSNWSDLSHVSAQPSPNGLGCSDFDPSKSGPSEETVGSADGESTYLLDNATSPPEKEVNSANLALRAEGSCPTYKETWPSHLGHRGSNIPPKMSLPSHYEASQNLTRHLEDDIMKDADACNFKCDVSFEMQEKDLLSDSNSYMAEDEVSSRLLANNKATGTNNLVFYKWPSMLKLDTHSGTLDSGSIYVILMPAAHFGTENVDVLYLWIGCNVSSEGSYSQLIRNDGKCEDSHAIVELVDRNLLIQKGFSTDAQIKIVKEGEEPVELLEHVSLLSLNKM
ncbi:protein-tyrosine-phosphatase MKP1-like [Salvia miltiorrhiza]|uniref:protein-tyrosine-phosphatase MKP1-like n=1 Tax=Salvia miltiorrhiza TaxID=226208 RepID=UPI0025ABBC8F|nr:protein-tyrosine-phosphatase MKP1-like [Salvia miltiorrhiza]XP_057776808.1 protein-tyrosine-phosphatase MKP1-like [Salvia miltiorrhiza]